MAHGLGQIGVDIAAPLLVTQGRGDQAREIVSTAYAAFSEGFNTPDLQAARSFLQRSPAASSTR